MIRILFLFASVMAAQSAPALVQQQYLFLTPESQVHLHPTLKLQQPVLQPITRVPSLEKNEQVLVYYPSAPFIQYPFVGVRQSWLDDLTNIWTQLTMPGGPADTPEDSGDDSSGSEDTKSGAKIELSPDAETIPTQQTPASTFPLIPKPNPNPLFVVGQPQFYGNFAGIQHLQALQPALAVNGRSANAEPEIVPIAAEQPQQELLKTDFSEQESLAAAPQSPAAETALNSESPRFFQSAYPAILNQNEEEDSASLEGKNENLKKTETPAAEAEISETLKVSDDPSVARAGPTGIALAGKSGLASSHPFATALVGPGGLALASPQGTSIAGDFLGESDEKQ